MAIAWVAATKNACCRLIKNNKSNVWLVFFSVQNCKKCISVDLRNISSNNTYNYPIIYSWGPIALLSGPIFLVYIVSQILIRSTFVFQISSEVQVALNPYYTIDYHNRLPNNKTAKMHFYILFFTGHAQRSRSVLCENCVQANSSFSNTSLLYYSVLNNKP